MANPSYTHIIMVVDASGSMSTRRQATIDGVNQYIKNQQGQFGKTTVSIITFSNNSQYVFHRRDVNSIPDFSSHYHCDGGTALLDAIGQAITDTVNWMHTMPDYEQPANIICVVQTDGEENQSHQYSKDQIARMIKHHEDNESWDFLFMGADQDAITAGAGMGFRAGKSLAYSGSPEKQREAWLAASAGTQAAKAGVDKDADFFGEQWRSRVR